MRSRPPPRASARRRPGGAAARRTSRPDRLERLRLGLLAAKLLLACRQLLAEHLEVDAGFARLREDRALLLLDVMADVLGQHGDPRLEEVVAGLRVLDVAHER